MSEQQKHFPEFYVTAPQACPYLAGRLERKLFTHLTHDKPRALIDNLLKGGFRRSQNIAYMPYCEGCQACVSVRVLVNEFEANRAQRRALQRHGALEPRPAELKFNGEHYALYRLYQGERHRGGGMDHDSREQYAHFLLQSNVATRLIEFREGGELRMVSIVDELADGLSSVYTFFDPLVAQASYGTFNILWQIEEAKRRGLQYVYLGYWIGQSRKMSYKNQFKPIEGLSRGEWKRLA